MKTIRTLAITLTLAALSVIQTVGAAVPTLYNLNRIYFKVDTSPTAIPTNVVLLTGNLTNWQKLQTNIVIGTFNPTSGYSPYNNAGAWADSWWYYTANGMGTDTNLFLGPGQSNIVFRDGINFVYANGGNGPGLKISNTVSHATAFVGLNTGGSGTLSASSGLFYAMGVILQSDGGIPGNDFRHWGRRNASPGPWGEIVTLTNYIVGFDDALGNHSWMQISQADTNSPMVFDLQTAGTAGNPRGYSFRTNGVEVFGFTNGLFSVFGVPIPMSTTTNQWTLLSVAEGATTNVTFSFNGKTYTMQAW